MAQDTKARVIIEAVDKATKTLGKITGTIVKGLGVAGVAALAGVAFGAIKAGQAFVGMAVDSAKLSGVQSTFENLSHSIGTSAIFALEALRESTRGMVSDMDLMAAGNQFMAMGLANTQDEMANLAEIATQLGSAMGSGPTESMENFSLLLANQSIPRLDSFGISSGVVRSKIEELQKANAGMTRETAFMTAVMEEAEVTLAKVGEQGDTSAAAFARMEAVSANLKIAIGQGLEPVVTNIMSTFSKLGQKLIPIIRVVFAGVGVILNQVFELFKTFGKSILKALGVDFQVIADDSRTWGENIVLMLASGMAAAIQAVVNVLMQLGQVIRSWLSPGSPPKLLPDLDRWGAEAATVYMDGWGEADFGIFNDLADMIGSHLKSLSEDVIPKEMLIPWLSTFNAEIANGINSLRETGTVGREVFDDLIDSAEFLPESIKEYARSLVDVQLAQENFNRLTEELEAITASSREELIAMGETVNALPQPFGDYVTALLDVEFAQDALASSMAFLESVTEDVARAQDELNAITSEYNEILNPLNDQLDELQDQKQAIKDQQRLAKLQEIIADEQTSAADRALAEIEMQEIAIRQQIKAVEDEKDVAIDAAKEKLDAAKVVEDAAKAEVDRAKDALKLAEDQAGAARDKARAEVEGAQEVLAIAETQLNVAQQLVQQQKAANSAINEQSSILDSLKETLDNIAAGAGGATDGIASAVDGISSNIGNVGAAFAGLSEGVLEQVNAMFDPLGADFEELGELWGEVFTGLDQEGINAIVAGVWESIKATFALKLEEIRTSLQEWLIEYGLQWLTSWEQLKLDFAAFFVNLMAILLLKLVEFKENVILWFADQVLIWATKWEEIKLNFAAWMLEVITKLQTWIADFQTKIADWFTELILKWQTKWEEIKLFFSTLLSDIVADLQEWIDTFLQKIIDFFTDFIATWDPEWQEVAAEFLSLLDGMIVILQEWIADFLLNISEWFTNLTTTWTEKWLELKTQFTDWWNTLIESLKGKLDTIIEDVSEWFQTLITTWKKKFQEIKVAFTKWWNNLIASLKRKLDAFVAKVTNFFTTLKTKWDTQWDSLKTKVTTMWDSIKLAFATWVADAVGVGKDIVDGIKAGVEAKASALSKKAASIVKDAIRAAKAAMGIESPSKVAGAEIGAPLAQGIGVGFEKGMQKVQADFNNSIGRAVTNSGRESAMSSRIQETQTGTSLFVQGDLVLNGVQNPENMLEQLQKLMV